ncbi:mechanosensitive ion channel family protein [Laspinema olomoucense]|uniref:Mechanosensitive ion channel family protein n=1 Tax=Laspinema olomoucense D3b TaxID=2953688 RepID=A0ABT2N7P4_9CYAN|nr:MULTISPECIES: mechanosensitive ion channel family protein [unclassified Laspinema]MCT7976036.1 mechanosensitive ion channel family protein [Laspinema sp. D3d]MCT7978496.1 mechanosensitive ion channel family protein [Laspinema sp. D3b]MCT7991332.1 mechanosensitive ion channel family protein [Laspinema sp. D3a]
MNPVLQEIKATLIKLIGEGVALAPAILIALVVLGITWYAANVVRRLTMAAGRRVVKNRSLRMLMVQTAYVAAWSVGIIVACVLAFPGLGLGDIIGLLGLSSVAIGFAFQDIFKNFLAGILLLLQEPFRLGDQIVVEGYEGTVEEIAIRSTQIRTYAGERVVIPNAVVFTNVVQVKTAFSHRRTDLEIGVDYNTPLPQAIDTLFKAVSQVPGVLSEPEPEVDIEGFGESSINMIVRYWTEPERPSVRRTQTQVAIALKEACDRENINIPYPIRTLYSYNQEKFKDDKLINTNGDF